MIISYFHALNFPAKCSCRIKNLPCFFTKSRKFSRFLICPYSRKQKWCYPLCISIPLSYRSQDLILNTQASKLGIVGEFYNLRLDLTECNNLTHCLTSFLLISRVVLE